MSLALSLLESAEGVSTHAVSSTTHMLLHRAEVDSFPQAAARQTRQAGRVLKCEPAPQSNNGDACPGECTHPSLLRTVPSLKI